MMSTIFLAFTGIYWAVTNSSFDIHDGCPRPLMPTTDRISQVIRKKRGREKGDGVEIARFYASRDSA